MFNKNGAFVAPAASFASKVVKELLWPTRCVSCDFPGELICDECLQELPWIEQRLACPFCGAPFGFLTCTECNMSDDRAPVIAGMSFQGTSADIIRVYKDEREKRLAPVLAEIMHSALEEASFWQNTESSSRFIKDETDALTFVPATPEAYIRRGFDHMELVARELSRRMNIPFLDALARISAHDQRKLDKKSRIDNVKNTMMVVRDVSGLSLLLIDDVCTTGASLRESSEVLYQRGARKVVCCVCARVW